MSKTTRKYLWPTSLVMSLALVGVVAAFVALATVGPQAAQAHDPCEGLTDIQEIAECEGTEAANPHNHDGGNGGNGNGDNGNGDNGNGDDMMHASMPMYFDLEGLDNGARLDWDAPKDVADDAEVVGYLIHRDAWNADSEHPINEGGDAYIHVYEASETDQTDLGLAYRTTYSYKVLALVRHSSDSEYYSAAVAEWWNPLGCRAMNDVVEGHVGDGPAIGPDNMTSPYCAMYDGLSHDADDPEENAQAVVKRTYDAKGYNKGEWSGMRTLTTADSGGRLAALLDGPSAVRMIDTSAACANTITVTWQEPMYFGTVPAMDENGVYVGPDYIGGQRAGLEEVGEDATGVTYQVQRMVNNGAWADVTPVGMSFTDMDVEYGNTYKYRARAMNGVGLFGPWSMITEELEEPPGVNAPSNVRATLNEEGNVVLQWTAPQGGNQEWFVGDDANPNVTNGDESPKLSYRIERVDAQNNDTGDFGERIRKHQYGPRSFDDPRITHEQTYTDENPYSAVVTYVVTALVDRCLPSEGNSVTLDTLISAPGTPGNVSATASDNMITVTWTAPADAGSVGNREANITGYNVERSTTSGSDFMPVVSGHSGTSYTDSGLDYDTTYYYRVIAVNSFGATSEMSAEATATTAAEIMDLTVPSDVTVSSLQNTVSVTWDPASIENADQVKAVLFDDGVTMIVDLKTFNAASDPGAATFTSVDSGTYKVTVASFRMGEPHKLSALMEVTVQ